MARIAGVGAGFLEAWDALPAQVEPAMKPAIESVVAAVTADGD